MKIFITAVTLTLLLSVNTFAGTEDDNQTAEPKEVIYIGPHTPCDPCTEPRTDTESDKDKEKE